MSSGLVPVALIIVLDGIFCTVMLWLLWKYKVNQKVRWQFCLCRLIFGVCFDP
jgi:hypothetical protein